MVSGSSSQPSWESEISNVIRQSFKAMDEDPDPDDKRIAAVISNIFEFVTDELELKFPDKKVTDLPRDELKSAVEDIVEKAKVFAENKDWGSKRKEKREILEQNVKKLFEEGKSYPKFSTQYPYAEKQVRHLDKMSDRDLVGFTEKIIDSLREVMLGAGEPIEFLLPELLEETNQIKVKVFAKNLKDERTENREILERNVEKLFSEGKSYPKFSVTELQPLNKMTDRELVKYTQKIINSLREVMLSAGEPIEFLLPELLEETINASDTLLACKAISLPEVTQKAEPITAPSSKRASPSISRSSSTDSVLSASSASSASQVVELQIQVQALQSALSTSAASSASQIDALQMQLQALQAENRQLRARLATKGTTEIEEPSRIPFNHSAAQIWTMVIDSELNKFNKDTLTDNEKIELSKLLKGLNLVEYDSKGGVDRVKPYRSGEADDNSYAYCTRKLEEWLRKQSDLLIDTSKNEGYVTLEDHDLETYMRGRGQKSNTMAQEFGLPRLDSMKEKGLPMWRTKVLELANKHKVLTAKDIKFLTGQIKVEVGKASFDEANKKNNEKAQWIAQGSGAKTESSATSAASATPTTTPPPPPRRAPPPPPPPSRKGQPPSLYL